MEFWRYLRGGGLAGLGSGALALALEVAELASADRSLGLVAVLTGLVLPAFCLAGTLAGAGWWALERLGALAVRWVGGGADRGSALVAAAVAILPLQQLVARLASGRQAARYIGAGWKQAAVVALLAAGVALAVWGARRVVAALVSSARRRLYASVGLLLLGLAVGLFVIDARLYRRLYGYLHLLLLAGYLVAGQLGTMALWRATVRSGAERSGPATIRSKVGALGALILLGVGLWQARAAIARDPQLHFVAADLSTVAAKLLSIWPVRGASAGPAFLAASPTPAAAPQGRHLVPGANVVLVTIDALRHDHVGSYGYDRPTTPQIDALAARAVRFDVAYCAAPLTCYSVPSFHTGDYLRSTLPLLPSAPATLAQMLAAKGYTTAAFYNESIFFCDDPRATAYGDRHFGFGYAETELRPAPALTERAVAYLNRFRHGRRKLLLWMHYFDVHEPYHRHPAHDYGSRDIDRYDSEISYVDAALGRLISALGQLSRPTILVLTSDHGEEFREHSGAYHGSTLYEEQVRIPLIVAVPGIGPRVSHDPAQTVDIVPTVLSLLGLPVPPSVSGRSLVPQLLGKSDPGRAAFAEVHTKKMVRLGNWKLIHDFRRSTYELYDLAKDPRERTNLIGRRPGEAARLKAKLEQWFDRLRAVGAQEEGRPEGIDLGRIGDRRAVPALVSLVQDPDAASKWREEAARLLGQLQDPRAADALWWACGDDDRVVADEAAIALGEIKDRRARAALPRVLRSSDDDRRWRAAIALGRVSGREAAPVLIETLYSGNWELQSRAAHYLGFVGDRSAVGPLIAAARQVHLRSRVAVALGRLARRHPDPRILPFLLDLARGDPHPDVRQRSLAAISFAGDRRAVPALIELLRREPDLSWAPEALGRLGAVGSAELPGVDLGPGAEKRPDWGPCHKSRSQSIDRFVGQSWCAMAARRATLELRLARRPRAPRLLLRLRALDADVLAKGGQQLEVQINGRALAPLALSRGWRALRLPIPAELWRRGVNRVTLQGAAPIAALDYLMLVDGAAR